MNQEQKILSLLMELDTLPNLQKSLASILKGHAEVLQSLYESKPNLEEGEVFIETLIIKMIFASKSILDLSFGSDLINYKEDKKFEIIDTPSIFILTRSVIEIFLTLEYLYFNELESEEKRFRYDLWRVSGYITREYFTEELKKEHIEIFEREEKIITELRDKIKESKYFSSLEKLQIWKLDKFGLPRLINWTILLKQSRLKSSSFENIYKLYSNYAHSEYLSMIQINEGSLNKYAPNIISTTETSLSKVVMINCKTIFLLKDKFSCVSKAFESLNKELRYKIEFWDRIGKE